MMRAAALVAVVLLAGCMARPAAEVSKSSPEDAMIATALPPMQVFPGGAAQPPQRSNADIASDFIDLQFRMESGRRLTVLTRFEGPVTVGMTGAVPPSARGDLTRLISRLRTEAGIDISLAPAGADASITIDFQPRAALRRAVPSASCFVVPGVTSLAAYRSRRNGAVTDWAKLQTRRQIGVFVPSDTSPQEVRDCLHEELAQALGPLNDLYHLPDSVFNDDNFHAVLTGFDMLILRAQYAPELRSGMGQSEVAARLPALLARLNPGGAGGGANPAGDTPRAWITAVDDVFGPKGSSMARRTAARRMLDIARDNGWADNRLAFSYFAVARAQMGQDPAAAADAFATAAQIYRRLPGGGIQAAHIDMQMAALALSAGRVDQALALTDQAIPVVQRAENASLLATLLLIRAEALAAMGRDAEAQAVRLDSLGWARYGFGQDPVVRARVQDIAALSARNGQE